MVGEEDAACCGVLLRDEGALSSGPAYAPLRSKRAYGRRQIQIDLTSGQARSEVRLLDMKSAGSWTNPG